MNKRALSSPFINLIKFCSPEYLHCRHKFDSTDKVFLIHVKVTAALAGNFGQNIDSTVISALGSQSTGMSLNQISSIKPQDLINSIGTLSTVTGWSEGQAMTIIQSLLSSGIIQVADFRLNPDFRKIKVIFVVMFTYACAASILSTRSTAHHRW